jgi:SPP1 family phage portal protein
MNGEQLTLIINKWVESKEYKNMIDGLNYYCSENDIKKREFKYIDGLGESKKDRYRANKKIPTNFLSTLIDQKVSYCLSKDVIVDNFNLSFDLNEEIDVVAEEASIKSQGWTFFYPSSEGELKTKVIESENIIPLYDNTIEKKLIGIIRLYSNDDNKFAEYWEPEGKFIFILEQEGYKLIEEASHFDNGNWGLIPFAPLYNNRHKMNDLQRIKTLIDCYDLTISDFANNFIDFQELILFIRNYSENVATETAAIELMDWLKKYKMISVRQDGGIDIISREVPYQARSEFLIILKKLIYTFGKGVDIDDLKGSSLTNVVIKAHFSLLDMKANKFIKEIKRYIKECLRINNKWHELHNKTRSDINFIDITINKTILINELENAEIMLKLDGIVSRRTLLKNCFMVDDVEAELKELENDQMEYNNNDGEGLIIDEA